MTDVIIVGAGASGLAAAYQLSKAGKKVMVIEARDRLGGRINTLYNSSFTSPVELGAEFVHGDLPVTLKLLKEAGINYRPAGGQMLQFTQGKINNGENFFSNWDLLEEKLRELKEEITVQQFLDKHFTEEHVGLKKSIKSFVEGYDAADITKASALAFRDEWLTEEHGEQHFVKGGYSQLIDFLANECKKQGGEIHLSSPVKEIKWSRDAVEVVTEKQTYKAAKVIITIPPPVLEAGSVAFTPAIPDKINAFKQIGNGIVIKLLLEFKTPFWWDKEMATRLSKNMDNVSFILSDETVPTWWTQYPEKSALLTGWLGGPKAEKLKGETDDSLLAMGLHSLSSVFQIPEGELKANLIAWHIANWPTDPYARGAYTYATVESHAAREVINKPIEDTLFFAGEALYTGAEMGTVEAALANGEQAAKKVLKLLQH